MRAAIFAAISDALGYAVTPSFSLSSSPAIPAARAARLKAPLGDGLLQGQWHRPPGVTNVFGEPQRGFVETGRNPCRIDFGTFKRAAQSFAIQTLVALTQQRGDAEDFHFLRFPLAPGHALLLSFGGRLPDPYSLLALFSRISQTTNNRLRQR